jgi:hypothetical protein
VVGHALHRVEVEAEQAPGLHDLATSGFPEKMPVLQTKRASYESR